MWRALVALVFALSLAVPAAAQERDFRLVVPVRLTKLMPAITGGVVVCVVGPPSIAADSRPLPHSAERVGVGVSTFSVDQKSRGFSGEVVVAFDAEPGKEPAVATHYKCWLQLDTGTDASSATGVPRADASELHLVPRPDAPSSVVVTGEVPR